MRRKIAWMGVVAALSGIAACNLIADGISQGNKYTAFGSGGASSSSSGTAGHGGTGGTGGTGGHGGTGPFPGSEEWKFALGSAGDDVVNAIAVAGKGHLFLTGKLGAPADLGCPLDDGDGGTISPTKGYLIEVDSTGKCLWGLFLGDGVEGTGVAVDASGNITLSGNYTGPLNLPNATSAGAASAFMARFGADHSFKWYHRFAGTLPKGVWSKSLAVNGNRAYVGGYFDGDLTVDGNMIFMTTGGNDGYVVGCPDDGTDCSFYVQVSGTPGASQDVRGIATPSDNSSIALVGSSEGAATCNGVPAASVDSDANALLALVSKVQITTSAALFGPSGKQFAERVVLSSNAGGPLFMAGTYYSQIQIGGLSTDTTQGGASVFVARVDGSTPKNLARFGPDNAGPDDQTVKGLAVNATDEVYVAGALSGKVTIGDKLHTSAGADDVYVVKYDATLNPLWSVSFGDIESQGADVAAVDPTNGGVIVAGHYAGTLQFDPKGTPLPTPAGTDIFVVKLRP